MLLFLYHLINTRDSSITEVSEYKTCKKCNYVGLESLRILTGKKHRQKKLWAFGSLEQQINSLKEVLKLKENFKKNKVVNGETRFFVIGPFCTHHSICLNTGF